MPTAEKTPHGSGKTIGKILVFAPIIIFVSLFLTDVLVRFFSADPGGASLGSPFILLIDALLLFSFLPSVVLVPVGAILWWKAR